jgi:hypothetical protein
MSLLDSLDGLANIIKRCIAEFLWRDIGNYLDNDLLNWNIILPIKGQPFVERLWDGPLFSTLPLLERDKVVFGGHQARLVIVHPQYNGIVECAFDTKRIFGKAMQYSLLHLISNDYCSQWDPNEMTRCMIGEFDRSFKPVWKTSLSYLLHSHSLAYMRAKLGTTAATQEAMWRDGDVGEHYGGNIGLFPLHEDVMNRLEFELENELHITHQQKEYFADNDEYAGRFIDVMRATVMVTENIIDEIMNDQETMKTHTIRRGVSENSDDDNGDNDNDDNDNNDDDNIEEKT